MPVTSYCSVVMIWLADFCVAIACLGDEGEGSGEEKTIKSKFGVSPPWPYS